MHHSHLIRPLRRLNRRRAGRFAATPLFVAAVAFAVVAPPIARADKTPEGKVVHELRIGTLIPLQSVVGEMYTKLETVVRKETHGQVEIKLYANGSAGDEATMVRKMRANQLDGAMLTAEGLGAIVPEILVLQAPGVIRDYAELDAVREELRGEIEAMFRKAGYDVLAWGDAGKIRLFSKKVVVKPDDMKSARPWIWTSSPTLKAFIDATGANGVPLPLPEVYPGLQTAMIDTVVASAAAVVGFQWHSQLATMSKEADGVIVGALVMKRDKLAALPTDVLEAFHRITTSLEVPFRNSGRALDAQAAKALAKQLKLVEMEPYRAQWEAVGAKARDALTGRLYSPAMLKRVQAIVDRTRKARK